MTLKVHRMSFQHITPKPDLGIPEKKNTTPIFHFYPQNKSVKLEKK